MTEQEPMEANTALITQARNRLKGQPESQFDESDFLQDETSWSIGPVNVEYNSSAVRITSIFISAICLAAVTAA